MDRMKNYKSGINVFHAKSNELRDYIKSQLPDEKLNNKNVMKNLTDTMLEVYDRDVCKCKKNFDPKTFMKKYNKAKKDEVLPPPTNQLGSNKIKLGNIYYTLTPDGRLCNDSGVYYNYIKRDGKYWFSMLDGTFRGENWNGRCDH